jgi:hypothetical protein
MTTVKIELSASMVYALAVFCNFLGETSVCGGRGTNPVSMMIKSIFAVVTASFMIVDSILLMVNVLITEIMGAVALLLCGLFGGQRSGVEWHQYVVQRCHYSLCVVCFDFRTHCRVRNKI